MVQKEEFGGYDCKFVTRPPTAFQTECLICQLILREPYQTTCCGKSFCRSCIQGVENMIQCPACRGKLELLPNKGLRQSLIQLPVWCTYREDGCQWSGELGELDRHLNEANHAGEYSQPFSIAGCVKFNLNGNNLNLHYNHTLWYSTMNSVLS